MSSTLVILSILFRSSGSEAESRFACVLFSGRDASEPSPLTVGSALETGANG